MANLRQRTKEVSYKVVANSLALSIAATAIGAMAETADANPTQTNNVSLSGDNSERIPLNCKFDGRARKISRLFVARTIESYNDQDKTVAITKLKASKSGVARLVTTSPAGSVTSRNVVDFEYPKTFGPFDLPSYTPERVGYIDTQVNQQGETETNSIWIILNADGSNDIVSHSEFDNGRVPELDTRTFDNCQEQDKHSQEVFAATSELLTGPLSIV